MKRGVLLELLLGTASAAHASDKPVYAPAPAWVKPAPPIDAAALTDASPIVVRFDSQQRLEDGRVWAFFDTATRAASTQQLSQIGDVKLPWQPAQGDLVIHTAEIIRGTQRIDLIKGGAPFTVLRREAELEQRMLDGMLTATMAAEGLSVGDVLHLSFSITRKDPTLKGDMQTFAPLLADPMRAGFARVRLSWPAASDMRWKSYADGVTAKPVVVGGYRELEVALPLAKQPEMPGDAPARFAKLPVLEATSFADWPAVSKAMAPLYATDGLIAPGSPLAAEVARITAAESDPLKRAAIALRLVQDKVRYLLMGMDTGNYVPQPPAQTWEKRYGDCKAKTLLLLALLRGMGIEAEPVAANLQMGDLVPVRLPSLGAFNHVLVRATIGGRDYWLDGTGSGTRLPDIGDTPPLGSVLPLRSAGATLMPIALRPNARPDVTVAVDLDDRGGVDTPTLAHAELTFRGGLAEAIGTAAAQASGEERRKMAQNILAEQVGSGNYVDPKVTYDADSGTTVIAADGLASTRWSLADRRYRLPLDAAVTKLDFSPDRARTAWSAIPVTLPGPSSIVYRTTLHLPDGGKGYTLEGDRALSATLAGARLGRDVTMVGDTVVMEDRVQQVGGEIAAADIPAARAALAQARNRLLTVAAPPTNLGGIGYWDAARRAGLHKPVETMFVRVIAADPKDAGVVEWRARFRAGAADRAGAVADYTAAIAIEPSVGRYLARGSLYRALGQDARQLADIEAARKLDPESDDALGALASYQSRHGQGAQAVALLDARIDRAGAKDRADWLMAKAFVQSDTGQKEAALATLDGAIGERPGNPDLLNGRCWVRGTSNVALDGALKDCTKAIELADSPNAALDSRAMVYYRLGRYDDALADLSAALDGAPDLAASLYMKGVVLHRTGRKADGDAALIRARLIDPVIDRTYADYGVRP